MKGIYQIFSIMLSLLIINSQITDQEKKNLIKEVYKRLNLTTPTNRLFRSTEYNELHEQTYDPIKIKEIIEKYNFPEAYNFIEEINPPVHIKNQENCGCCWAFASSTALAYRYYKQGINVNLSPQYLLSCFSGDCEDGGYLIDTEFLMVKEGTVTEECMPYTSEDGKTIEQCPSECKNGDEFIKYKSKNAYSTTFDFENNYYDVVTIIMDQLINYGPVVTNILIYEDFDELYKRNCANKIYKYDGKSEYSGGHAVVIVGYGYNQRSSKYYWIIQNSWGKDFCDNGFAKIEFGEINIENVGFSEPYIENVEDTNEKEISVTLSLNEDCKFEFTTDDEKYDDSFEMDFEGEDSIFHYQCSKAPFINSNKGICIFDLESLNSNKRGNYVYKEYKPLHNINTFNINFLNESDKQFHYSQYDVVDGLISEHFYISEEGSSILLLYISNNDEKMLPNIYPSRNQNNAISNCEIVNLYELDFISCRIGQNELQIFDTGTNKIPLVYELLCGRKQEMSISVHQLDKTKYPIIRIQQVNLPDSEYLNKDSEIIILANIEGSVLRITGYNYFFLFIQITKDSHIREELLICEIPYTLKVRNNFEIECWIDIDEGEKIRYDTVFLLPFYLTDEDADPFEVILKNKIQAIVYNYDHNTKNYFSFSNIIFNLFLLIIVLID